MWCTVVTSRSLIWYSLPRRLDRTRNNVDTPVVKVSGAEYVNAKT